MWRLSLPPFGGGAGAGFIASFLGLIAVYLYLCAWTGAATGGDIAVILLSAVTLIPLMMLLVFFLPNVFLGAAIGMGVGAMAKIKGATPRLPFGILIGVVFSYLVFHELLPLFVSHKPSANDITVMLTPLPFAAVYGAFYGAVVWKLYAKIS